jgi:N-methylhydantoinase A
MPTDIRYRVGVDIGGTFTDVVLLGSDGSLITKKVSSTPDDYGRGIINGVSEVLDDLGLPPGAIDGIVHATTVATNTILEFKGARTALVTTEGFRDVLEMRRLRIPDLYNLQYEKPAPLVPRRLVFEVPERMGPKGEVWRELDEAAVEAVAAKLAERNVEALAICLLHSYVDPTHERRVEEILRKVLGEDIHITCSSDILREMREYERTSTTVVNAYVGPVVTRYLDSLVKQLKGEGIEAPLEIMQSNGGIMTARAAMRKPACIVESGPAAGVIASARVAKSCGHDNVISLDMGGTTAKAAMIENGEPAKTSEYEVGTGINLSSMLVKGGGYPIKLPFIDVSEIGAGGGSIVSTDEVGLVKVGPRSAGSVPGPICYDQDGADPTLTDALVTLGYFNPDYLVGGSLTLNAAKARAAIEDRVARPMGKSLLEAAHGIFAIAVANMTRAVKAVSTYRGRDPRDFILFAFGGGGPVMAAEIARAFQMRRVLVPVAPGVFSALGLLFSDTEHEFIQTFFAGSGEVSSDALEEAFAELEGEALSVLAGEGYEKDRVTLKRLADMRYSGQAFELTVPVATETLSLEDMSNDFNDEHERTYGYRSDTDPVDLVNIKIVARGMVSGPRTYEPMSLVKAGKGKKSEREAYFGPEHGLLATPVISRQDLIGQTIEGPLIIEEYDATCLVPPGCSASLDDLGNIDIAIGDES